MIPLAQDNERLMMEMLGTAIKSVYASTYYKSSKAYMTATSNVIDEEKMAVVMQTVSGNRYGHRFYPTLSGVARSINFYPIGLEKPEEGIANIAFGLGKYIVDGGQTIRFSPKYPKKVLSTSSPDLALKETQKQFYALDLRKDSFHADTDDSSNLLLLKVKEAEKDPAFRFVASTYDYQNSVIRDGVNYEGKKLVTFNNILKHDTFPLADILTTLLEVGQKEMGNPVEIEFAVELNVPKNIPKTFYILQIRPIVDSREEVDVDIQNVDKKEAIIWSDSALGNGMMDNIRDLVYIRPDKFDPSKNPTLVSEIDRINSEFVDRGENYVLIGPGRWGSADPWLGIPVKWPQISAARVIVESGLKDYHIDPSQGTHFFQNLTSFRVGYFTLNPFINEGYYDVDFLNSCEAVFEDEFIRHIRFNDPIRIAIDGRKNLGVVYKPV
jgi:hypothetical protein